MVRPLNLIFFGTPEFAVPTLRLLCNSDRSPAIVISQPSRRAGRGRKLGDPPVVQFARSHGLEVRQPEQVSSRVLYEELAALTPAVAVVVAFGQIFRQPLLDLPPLGCINLHASLLPSYRGPSPIEAAIASGEETTGVTLMRIIPAVDAGPVLGAKTVAISQTDTAQAIRENIFIKFTERFFFTQNFMMHHF